jgi:hypothetical protein
MKTTTKKTKTTKTTKTKAAKKKSKKTKKPKTPSTKPSPGHLTDTECSMIRRILDQVIAGRLSLAEGESRAKQIRARTRRRVA